jgi:hypothetical protein
VVRKAKGWVVATEAILIGRLDVEAVLPDTDAVHALRSRIEALCWRQMPQVLERVCAAAAPSDSCIRVGRLDVDLGIVSPDHLESEALDRLEAALADALAKAISDARQGGSPNVRLISNTGARLDAFETYLATGTVASVGRAVRFDAVAELVALADAAPGDLVAMLRRHAGHRRVLERLVLQLGDRGLARLVAVLSPGDAQLILGLIEDVLVVHRTDPPAELDRLPPPELHRLVWVTSLEFLLRDAGSQFNRRRFLQALLEREAERTGIAYGALLDLLEEAVRRAQQRVPLKSSLPRTLAELLAERRDALVAGRSAAGGGGDPAGGMLEALIRAHGRDAAALAAAVAPLGEVALTALLDRLEPALGGALVAALARAQAPGRRAAGQVAERVADWLTGGSGGGGDTALIALVRALADEPERLAQALGKLPLAALDRLLAALAGSRAAALADAVTLLETVLASPDLGWFVRLAVLAKVAAWGAAEPDAALVLRQAVAAIASRLGGTPHDLARRLARALGDRADAPAHLLHLALAPWLEAVGDGDGDGLVRLVASLGGDGLALAAILLPLPAKALRDLVRRLRPRDAATLAALRGLLAELDAAGGGSGLAADAFEQQMLLAAVLFLAAGPADRAFDPAGFLRLLLRRLARQIPLTEAQLAGRWLAALGDRGGGAATMARSALASLAVTLDGVELLVETIRKVRPEPGQLARMLDEAPPASLDRLMDALGGGGPAAQLTEQLDLLAQLLADAGVPPLDGAAMGRRLRVAAIARLAGMKPADSWDAAALVRQALDALARSAALGADTLVAGIETALAARRGVAADGLRHGLAPLLEARAKARQRRRQQVESFLQGGLPRHAGALLSPLLAEDRAWLASALTAALDRAERAGAEALETLGRRLRFWLLPAEMALVLDDRHAARLQEAETAVAARQMARAHQDRLALIAHWLDRGDLPAWAPPGLDEAWVAAELAELGPAEMIAVLPAAGGERGAERVARRLGAAVALLGREAVLRLLARMAPWMGEGLRALAKGQGPLAGLLSARSSRRPSVRGMAARRPVLAPAGFPDFDADRLFLWLDGGLDGPMDADQLALQLMALADRGDPALLDYLAANRGRPVARARWAALLPPRALARLVDLLVPGGGADLVEAVTVIGAAWRSMAPFGARRPEPGQLWAVLLDHLAVPGAVDLVRLVDRLMDGLAGADPVRKARLRARARHLAEDGGHAPVRAALRRDPKPAIAARSRAPDQRRAAGRDQATERAPAQAEAPDNSIFISNSGLVLFNPYLPMFFERLGLLTPLEAMMGRKGGIEPASRGVHLLQYLADGRLDAPEPELVLNKILCGQPSAYPVEPSLEATPEDLATCDGLLAAVIANWPPMVNTSADGLRETYLRRDGKLRYADGKWMLKVQRKTLDVLMDQLPWSYGIVTHKWMKDPLYVTW